MSKLAIFERITMYITRSLGPYIQKGAEYFPVIAILGPRQSGKTTLAKKIFPHHTYLSLEDWDLRSQARHDPRTFLMEQNNSHGIIIDEFQYVPELLSYIQTIVDKIQRPAHFILTGSQNFLMNQSITQSLAGRVALYTLLPLSVQELKNAGLLPAEIEPMLYQGCYPAIYAKQVPPDQLYANYIQTYIERDVRHLTQVGDLNTFRTFLSLCATHMGQILNLSSLGNACGISDNTAKRWLSILEASYILFRLFPYFNNFGKRYIKRPKLFFYDPGLVCHLIQVKQHDLSLHPHRGNIFESFIISDINKQYYNSNERPSLYFWQDKSGHEVDCIVYQGVNKLLPIEIKASRTYSSRFIEGLQYWYQIAGESSTKGYVIYAGSAHQPIAKPVVSWQNLGNIF